MMKDIVIAVILSCAVLASCRYPHVEEIKIIEPGDTDYELCDAKQAEFSMVVDLDIKGVIKQKETYHFPYVITSNELFVPAMLCCYADGGGSGYTLSYGVWKANETGITFRVTCSYTVNEKRGKVERNLSTAWFEPKHEERDEMSISLQWKKKEPKHVSEDMLK